MKLTQPKPIVWSRLVVIASVVGFMALLYAPRFERWLVRWFGIDANGWHSLGFVVAAVLLGTIIDHKTSPRRF